MASREETLRKLEDFNKRAEEARNTPPEQGGIQPAGVPAAVTAEQKKIIDTPDEQLSNAERVEKKALQTEAELKREEREREAKERERQQEEKSRIQRLQDAGRNASNAALDALEPPVRWMERVPTPFGLGVILFIAIVFILAIVPVDAAGNTRLKLIWLTISGKTHLLYQDVGSGDFGGQNQPNTATTPNQPAPSNGRVPLTSQNAQNVPIEIPDLTGLDFMNL